MSTPICHRTLGPMVRSYGDGEPRDQQAFGCPCIGSACAMWVPEARAPQATAAFGIPAVSLDEEGDPWTRVGDARYNFTLSDRGWCAENKQRSPWNDPARGAK